MNTRDREELVRLSRAMRVVAAKSGGQHAFWDVIFDVDAFSEGKPTMTIKTTGEWISFCKNLLGEK